MDVLTVRLDSNLSKKIESILKEFNYSTKTDFVREAIRSKVCEMEEARQRKEAIKAFEKGFGAFKGKALLSDKEFDEKRDEFAKEFIKKFDSK